LRLATDYGLAGEEDEVEFLPAGSERGLEIVGEENGEEGDALFRRVRLRSERHRQYLCAALS
jgi:hypothetical protein